MAIPVPARAAGSLPDDLVTLKQALALMRRTPYPASRQTLRRWLERSGKHCFRFEGIDSDYVSFTDVLEAQRDAARRENPQP